MVHKQTKNICVVVFQHKQIYAIFVRCGKWHPGHRFSAEWPAVYEYCDMYFGAELGELKSGDVDGRVGAVPFK